jgi:ABC-type branched-subunit amino acid transport system permease subunit
VRDSKFDSANGAFTVPGRTTAVFSSLHEPVVDATPTAIATEAISTIADPTVILTLAGVIGAFLAVITMLFALRRKGDR